MLRAKEKRKKVFFTFSRYHNENRCALEQCGVHSVNIRVINNVLPPVVPVPVAASY